MIERRHRAFAAGRPGFGDRDEERVAVATIGEPMTILHDAVHDQRHLQVDLHLGTRGAHDAIRDAVPSADRTVRGRDAHVQVVERDVPPGPFRCDRATQRVRVRERLFVNPLGLRLLNGRGTERRRDTNEQGPQKVPQRRRWRRPDARAARCHASGLAIGRPSGAGLNTNELGPAATASVSPGVWIPVAIT